MKLTGISKMSPGIYVYDQILDIIKHMQGNNKRSTNFIWA